MNNPNADISGTSLMGKITASYDEIVDLFGLPVEFDVHKTHNEWRLELEGHVITVYDYYEDGKDKREYDWHIGGFSPIAVDIIEFHLAKQRKA
jgi:hypothetical protein